MTPKAKRADAQRSREQLLTAALRAFTALGTEASLDGIARDAGVGNATLYRHFPTREALVEAVHRHEIERVGALAVELLNSYTPQDAFREWMKAFVAFMTVKHGMADVFRAVIAKGGNPYGQTLVVVLDAVRTLIAAQPGENAIRSDAELLDILILLNGLAFATSDENQIDRLIDLVMHGLHKRD